MNHLEATDQLSMYCYKDFVNGEIKTFDVPGIHKSRRDIMNEPNVGYLANELKNLLERKFEESAI